MVNPALRKLRNAPSESPISYFITKIIQFRRKIQNYVNSVKKTHVFRKGRHFCEFCENDVRFPWVEFVDSPKNSLNFYEKRIFLRKRVSFL